MTALGTYRNSEKDALCLRDASTGTWGTTYADYDGGCGGYEAFSSCAGTYVVSDDNKKLMFTFAESNKDIGVNAGESKTFELNSDGTVKGYALE